MKDQLGLCSLNCHTYTMTGNCSASQRVLANSLRVVSAKRGNPPVDSDIDDSGKLNPYPSQTDGYDSDILEEPKHDDTNNDKQSADLARITCPAAEDDYAKPINERWAKIVKDNWATKTLNENLRKIINNHKSPENCTMKPPSVNPLIWKLLSSWQKKSDVNPRPPKGGE